MKRLSITLAAALCTLLVVSPSAAAQLGRRHIGIGIGMTWVGDETIDGTSLDFSARIRLPIARHFDVVAFHSQAMLEGADETVEGAPRVKSKDTEYGVDLIGHVLPGRTANPFVGAGVSNAMTQTTVDGKPTFADEDLKFKLAGGAEVRLAGDVSLNLGVAYQGSFRASYGSEITAAVSLNGWVTKLLLVSVGVEESFDEGDTAVSARVSYGF